MADSILTRAFSRSRRLARLADAVLAALRVLAALLLMQHGLQKFFGLLLSPERPFAGAPAPFTQRWIGGLFELVGGALLALGLFTRPVAFLLAGQLAVVYFQFHAPRSFYPAMNGGEHVILFCFVFLYLWANGPGPYSVDGMLERGRAGR